MLCKVTYNGSGLCVVALSINLKLTTTLDRAITQNPCYALPFLTISKNIFKKVCTIKIFFLNLCTQLK